MNNWLILIQLKARVLSRFSCVQLFVTPWTAACQAPLSVGFSWQEYWSELPRPPPGDLPNPRMEPGSPVLQADALPSEQTREALIVIISPYSLWYTIYPSGLFILCTVVCIS